MEITLFIGGFISFAIVIYLLVCFILAIVDPDECCFLTLLFGRFTMFMLIFGAIYCFVKFLQFTVDKCLVW